MSGIRDEIGVIAVKKQRYMKIPTQKSVFKEL